MSAQMPMTPPPPGAPPGPADLFPPELIEQIAMETGYPPEQIMADIERTGATTKEQLYPQFYTGQGIQPPPGEGQPAGPGVMQGEAPPGAMPPPPPGAMPPEAVPPGAPAGLPPEALEAMNRAMGPPKKKMMR